MRGHGRQCVKHVRTSDGTNEGFERAKRRHGPESGQCPQEGSQGKGQERQRR